MTQLSLKPLWTYFYKSIYHNLLRSVNKYPGSTHGKIIQRPYLTVVRLDSQVPYEYAL